MIKNSLLAIGLAFIMLVASSCTIVMPDEVAVKRRLGRLDGTVRTPGTVTYNPFTTTVLLVKIRTKNLAILENLPSREGLTIQTESSILYSIRASMVPQILQETGTNYETDLILPVFRSAAADICSQYDAKDMHSAKRSVIEQEIKYRMSEILYNKGFNIEAVLLKSIKLPERISASIERKLEAEQEALRMAFVAEQQRKEVERQLILEEGNKKTAIIRAEGKKEATILEAQAEAEAIEIKAEAVKRSNNLINSTITPNLLKQQQIEAFKELSKSPNSKLMILDAETQIMNLFGKD